MDDRNMYSADFIKQLPEENQVFSFVPSVCSLPRILYNFGVFLFYSAYVQ